MNINDSDKMSRLLHRLDFIPTTQPDDADLILLNTCSIREKAEQKVFSSLGKLRAFKQARPSVMIGVAGCMAQMLGDKIRRRAPYVDLVFGTYAIQKLPELIAGVLEKRRIDPGLETGITAVSKLDANDFDFLPLQKEDWLTATTASPIVQHLTIQNGCNKNCSYCIVPTVRGREISRPAAEIIDEAKQLIDRGVREIILVGQTVNSYGKGSDFDFSDLLRQLNALAGLKRLRFVTSHPRDLNEKLMHTMADCETICEHLHLPVQSGSDLVLRQMYRGYTAASYLKKLESLRRIVPGIAITTDIIVAFPGESEADFQATLQLMQDAGFANSYSFIYSPRPHTVAAQRPDAIAPEIAQHRLQQLQSLQRQMTKRITAAHLGQKVRVLIESQAQHKLKNADSSLSLSGRTRTNWNVFIAGKKEWIGEEREFTISHVMGHSLQAKEGV